MSSTFSPTLTVISAYTGAFCASSSRVCASTTITSDDVACALAPPRGSFCRLMVASGIVTSPVSVTRSAVRTRVRSGVTMTRAPGMSAANTRSPPMCMSILPERSAFPANCSLPSPATMLPSTVISPEGVGRTCSCPFFNFRPIAGMSAASSTPLTWPDSSGRCTVPATAISASTLPCTLASCGASTASGARSGICPRTRPAIGDSARPRS